MSMSESVTEFSEVLPPYFPLPTSSSVRVGALVVVVLIVVLKLLLHLLCLPRFLYIVNECCMKSHGQHIAGSGPIGLSVLRATTTTTTI